MRIVFRMDGKILAIHDLKPGSTISVGRSPSCDVVLSHDHVSRKQGVLTFEDGVILFKEKGEPEIVHDLSKEHTIRLACFLELVLETKIDSEPTLLNPRSAPVAEPAPPRKGHLIATVLAGTAACAALVIGLLTLRSSGVSLESLSKHVYDAKSLHPFASPRVVRFEVPFDSKIAGVKKWFSLKDEDFFKTMAFCTGFWVADDMILTAQHCLYGEGMQIPPGNVAVKTQDGKQVAIKRILGMDVQKDWLLLEVQAPAPHPSFEIVKAPTSIGDTVFSLGHPEGLDLAIREGVVSSYTEDPALPSFKYIRFSAAASPGNSGGPLLDRYGRVVAIVSGRSGAENYNLGIPASELVSAVDQFGKTRKDRTVELVLAKLGHPMDGNGFYMLGRSLGLILENEESESLPFMNHLVGFKPKFKFPATIAETNQAIVDQYSAFFAKKRAEFVAEKPNYRANYGGWEDQVTAKRPWIIPLARNSKPGSWEEDRDSIFSYEPSGQVAARPDIDLEPIGQADWEAYDREDPPANMAVDWASRVHPLRRKGLVPVSKDVLVSSDAVDLGSSEVSEEQASLETGREFDVSFRQAGLSADERRTRTFDALKSFLTADGGFKVWADSIGFVRPRQEQMLISKDFPSDFRPIRTLKDGRGRDWNVYEADLYGTVSLYAICHEAPMLSHCRLLSGDVDEDSSGKNGSLSIFPSQVLDRDLIAQGYVSKAFLKDADYKAYAKQTPEWKDFDLLEEEGTAKLSLKSLGVQLKLGQMADLLEIQWIPGLFRTKAGESKWVALGANYIRKAGKHSQWCFAVAVPEGTTVFDQRSNLREKKLAERKHQARTLASAKGKKGPASEVWEQELPKNELGVTGSAFGACSDFSAPPKKKKDAAPTIQYKFSPQALF